MFRHHFALTVDGDETADEATLVLLRQVPEVTILPLADWVGTEHLL